MYLEYFDNVIVESVWPNIFDTHNISSLFDNIKDAKECLIVALQVWIGDSKISISSETLHEVNKMLQIEIATYNIKIKCMNLSYRSKEKDKLSLKI